MRKQKAFKITQRPRSVKTNQRKRERQSFRTQTLVKLGWNPKTNFTTAPVQHALYNTATNSPSFPSTLAAESFCNGIVALQGAPQGEYLTKTSLPIGQALSERHQTHPANHSAVSRSRQASTANHKDVSEKEN